MWTSETLNAAALSELQGGEYASLGIVHTQDVEAKDIVVDLSVMPGASDGERHLMLFVRTSFDGEVWSTGPSTGFSRADEPNLNHIERLPLNTPNKQQCKSFSIRHRLGFIPPYVEIVVRNNSGDSLAASGHAAQAHVLT